MELALRCSTASQFGLAAFLALSPTLAAPITERPIELASPVADTVDSFYASRAGALIWLKDNDGRAAALRFSSILKHAGLDGLPGDANLAAQVDAALNEGGEINDKIISVAWVHYIQTLATPAPEVTFGDPYLMPKKPATVAVLGELISARSMSEFVNQATALNPLHADFRQAAIDAGASNEEASPTLRRLTMIPPKGRAILVNLATAELWMLVDGRAVDTMKVIVGKAVSPTPELVGTIHYVTFNPYWHILDEVVQRKVAPVVLQRGVSYLKAARYETVSDWTKSEPVDPSSIDWQAVARGDQRVFIRQRPGAANMMGAMKFSFENEADIFLHDTPHKELFRKTSRRLSLGCVRLEHAERLANWLLDRDFPSSKDEPEKHVQLKQGVPVFILDLGKVVQVGSQSS